MDAPVFDVLMIDDEEEGHLDRVHALRDLGVRAAYVHPDDLTKEQLGHAKLLLIDFNLRAAWERAREAKPAHCIADGVALASCLRRVTARDSEHPIAIALLTSLLEKVLDPLPGETRPHVVARLSNIEWAFSKNDVAIEQRVVQLLRAVESLPRQWDSQPWDTLFRLLGAQDGLVNGVSVEAGIRQAQPPVHDLSLWSHGLAVVRWILHRVLPYPCFLIDEWHLAAQLGVEPGWLRPQLGTEAFTGIFGACEYQGVLSAFSSRRWWARAVNQMLWNATAGRPHSRDRIRAFLEERLNTQPVMLEFEDPVVALDTHLNPHQVVDLAEAVRLQPDDWPLFASHAFTTKGLADANDRLGALRVGDGS